MQSVPIVCMPTAHQIKGEVYSWRAKDVMNKRKFCTRRASSDHPGLDFFYGNDGRNLSSHHVGCSISAETVDFPFWMLSYTHSCIILAHHCTTAFLFSWMVERAEKGKSHLFPPLPFPNTQVYCIQGSSPPA